MKKIKQVLLGSVIAMMMAQPLFAETHGGGDGTVPAKSKSLFAFKTDRKFVGAKVEVLFSNGDVVTTQTLQKRKMFIDFGDVQHGLYTIRVSKGDRVKEFHYDKK
jgi:hypothetical protein